MKIIAGNWKMNGTTETLADMTSALQDIKTQNRVILCVPYTMLCAPHGTIAIGAQDVSAHTHGAYTGEISANMIAATGAKYIIVGHSECREYHGDTNDIVRAKAERAITSNLTPIICIGETMNERDGGETLSVIEQALRESVPACATPSNIIIAYEPRWAIGAGITPSDDEIAKAHKFIAKILNNMGMNGTSILYGASVRATNAAQIMSIPHVDGVLVGGASLKKDDFIPIINSVE